MNGVSVRVVSFVFCIVAVLVRLLEIPCAMACSESRQGGGLYESGTAG